MPVLAYSECKEYKLIDHGGNIEAICVGETLTAKEKYEMELEKLLQKKDTAIQKKEQRQDRNNDQLDFYVTRKRELDLQREEVLLKTEKERLRRNEIKNNRIEAESDDTTRKLNKAMPVRRKQIINYQ